VEAKPLKPLRSTVLMRVITPPLRLLSVPVASLALVALRQLAAMPFCVANMLVVACAWLVPGVAVPLILYRLKQMKTQSGLQQRPAAGKMPARASTMFAVVVSVSTNIP